MGAKRIEIATLRSVCEQIFNFIENDLKIASVDIDEHLYWTLPEDIRFDMTKIPTANHVGDLVDDYDFVAAAAKDSEQAVPLVLEHVAPLLAVLANKVSSSR